MEISIWLPISAGLLASLAPITQGGLRKIDEKRFAKYARARRLPLPDQLRMPVLQRISRRERMAMICGGAGMLVGLALALVLGRLAPERTGGLGALITCGLALGGSLGGFVAALRTPQPASDAPRVARSVQTDVRDYQTRGERVAFALAPVSILLGLGTAWLIWALLPTRPEDHLLLMTVATAVSLVLLAGWALLIASARLLVQRPQRARDDLELAWDDADRTDALRGLTDNGIAAGMIAPFVSLIVAGGLVVPPQVRAGSENLTLQLGIAALVVGLICWAILLVPYLSGRFTANPSLKLWRGASFTEPAPC
ncbi:hypothetical protein HJ590_10475 [Naumannella sp. ID2617S]|nr:hypothetical protein [Naumannella sp. ID2617S]